MEWGALYMRFVQVLTLQYVFSAQIVQIVMGFPLASLVEVAWYPSEQKQSVTRRAVALEVLLAGHWLATPVQHQNPAPQGLQGWFAVPL